MMEKQLKKQKQKAKQNNQEKFVVKEKDIQTNSNIKNIFNIIRT